MGYYINPTDMTKEEWLKLNGERLTQAPDNYKLGNMIAVCLVDNGMFTAAAIAYSQEELNEFKGMRDPTAKHQPSPDHRPKKWYFVPIPLLRKMIDFPGSDNEN